MNSYDTREMLEAIKLRNPMKTFFADTFFKIHRTHIAEKIDVDIKKSKRRLAPFVAPRKGGKVLTVLKQTQLQHQKLLRKEL